MGNQVSSTKIPAELLKLEIDYIRSRQLCSVNLKAEIDADIEIMLRSIDQPTEGQSIESQDGKGKLQPEIKEVLLDRINEYKLSDEVNRRFFDPQLMSMITCLYGNLLNVDRQLFQVTPAAREYFRLTNNLSVGNWGIVFRAKNSGAELNFIIKTQVTANVIDLSIHEVFAALKALNPLRVFCPNFSVLYGGFVCGKPDGVTGLLCGGRENVPYTIYEAIPGNSLWKMINNLTNEMMPDAPLTVNINKSYAEVLCALLQIYFSLKIAHQQAYDFSHRDLHAENVIMRPLDKERLVRYRSQYMRAFQITNRNGQSQIIEATFDYYLRTSYVATFIDYDNCELYLPVGYGPNDIRTTRFGKADHDPLGRPISGDPNLSHLRDIVKILGFVAYVGLESRASQPFKTLLAELYLQSAQPQLPDKYRVNNPRASTLNTKLPVCDQIEIIHRERETFFQLTHEQVRLSREGLLIFDNFLEVFTRLVPANYLEYIMAVDTKPAKLGDDVGDARQIKRLEYKLKLEVLGCKVGECASEVETYRKIINPQDEAKMAVRNPFELQNLAYQIQDVKKEALRLDNDFRSDFKAVRIAPQPNNPELTVPYREVLMAKLLLAEAELTVNRAQNLAMKMTSIFIEMNSLLQDLKLPKHEDFFKFDKDYVAINQYRHAISRTFRLLAYLREARTIDDALSTNHPQLVLQYRPDLNRYIDRVEAFMRQQFIPWRDELLRLVNAGFFRQSNSEMARVILSKLV